MHDRKQTVERFAQPLGALQDDLPNSRAIRRGAALEIYALLICLQKKREEQKTAVHMFERLVTDGSSKRAASAAFAVAEIDRSIESMCEAIHSLARRMACEEALEGMLRMVAGAAPAGADRGEGGVLAPVGREDEEDVSVLRRAFEAELERMVTDAAQAGHEEQEVSATISALGRMLEAVVVWVTAGAAPAADGREGGGAHVLPDGEDPIAAIGQAFATTGNPLYVWKALALVCVPAITGTETPDRLLPGWCVAYLGRVAESLMNLSPPGISPAFGMPEQAPAVSRALGLTRQGWDAYAEWLRDRAAESDAELLHRVKALGIPDKDAMEAAIGKWGLKDERSVRHRLQRARRATPRPARPGP